MRDPKRIDEVTAKLNELWHKYPDLRFWQLLSALPVSEFTKIRDLFFVEDDITMKALDKAIEEGL